MAILVENMRREGFELSVSPPRVLFKTVCVSLSVVCLVSVLTALSHRKMDRSWSRMRW